MRRGLGALCEDGGTSLERTVGDASHSVGTALAGFGVERFEYIRATEAVALLRVVALWPPASVAHPSHALLMVSLPAELRHFAPLSVGDDAAQWSMAGQESCGVAFSVPLALVDEDNVRFSLRPTPDCVVGLGVPTQRVFSGPPASIMRAGGTHKWRQQLGNMIADIKNLERRVLELCRTIHDRAGLEYRHPQPWPADRRTERGAQPATALEAEVSEGLRRVAALEARLAELERDLRSGGPGGEESGAERDERRA